ncbi:branched-chain amino acid ABC transporter permease [Sulfitobacter sp.]|uniref:branched-chain amino acid ABC transporter permease n=1 Tax=Sulfitobacter sp. TaxID=1903071 RepID=UPI0032981B14
MLAQLLANGIVIGSSYVLVAVGLTLIFGILKIVNFAHGEFYMLGGYAGVLGSKTLGWPVLPTLALVVALMALFGLAVQRLVFRPIGGGDPTNAIVASFGLSIFLQNFFLETLGAEPMISASGFAAGALQFGPVFLTRERVAIVLATAVIVAVLVAILRGTWVGLSLRALSANPVVARTSGIDVGRVSIVTFVLGTILAGISGAMMSTIFMVQPSSGALVVMKAFVIVVVAGMGRIEGAIVVGLALGMIEALVSGYVGNAFRDIVGFVIVMLVLYLRPEGLFGTRTERS